MTIPSSAPRILSTDSLFPAGILRVLSGVKNVRMMPTISGMLAGGQGLGTMLSTPPHHGGCQADLWRALDRMAQLGEELLDHGSLGHGHAQFLPLGEDLFPGKEAGVTEEFPTLRIEEDPGGNHFYALFSPAPGEPNVDELDRHPARVLAF